jgi:hypothetical protein
MNVMHPALEQLRSQLQGRVIEPGDPDYDQAKTVFYGGEERHPAGLARVADDGDADVRLVSDPSQVREYLQFPPFGQNPLDNSLQHLSDLVAWSGAASTP